MLFNMIPIWEGGFLNFDCSVPPSTRGESKTSTGSWTKPQPLHGVPLQGMANDRCLAYRIISSGSHWIIGLLQVLQKPVTERLKSVLVNVGPRSLKKNRQSQTPDLSNRFIVIILFFGPSTSWSTSFYYHVFSVRLYVIWYLDDVVGEIGEKHVFEVCQGVLRRNKESGKLQILCGLLTGL